MLNKATDVIKACNSAIVYLYINDNRNRGEINFIFPVLHPHRLSLSACLHSYAVFRLLIYPYLSGSDKINFLKGVCVGWRGRGKASKHTKLHK